MEEYAKQQIDVFKKNQADFLWGNCYRGLDGAVDVDDDYDVTHWMPLPSKI